MGEPSTDQHSFTEKGVSPPPPHRVSLLRDEIHEKNETFTPILLGGLRPFGTIAYDPDVAVAVGVTKPHVLSRTLWLKYFKISEEDEPVAPKIAKSDSFKLCPFATYQELLARRGEEEILNYKLRMFRGVEVLEDGKVASVQAPKDPNGNPLMTGIYLVEHGLRKRIDWHSIDIPSHAELQKWEGGQNLAESSTGQHSKDPNPAFASEGGNPVMTEIDLVEHGKPLPTKGMDHHIIYVSAHTEEDSPWCKFLKGKQDQNLRGLCLAVSGQTILSLVGGAGAMNLPKPIFYSAAAANAIAFGGSALALLLVNRKPSAAKILEMVGFASAGATFLLMMSAFMPWK